MSKTNRFFQIVAVILLTVSYLLTCIDYWSFQESFYRDQYAKNNTTQATGMNEEDLMKTTHVLLDYLKDKRDNIDTQAVVLGQQREVFDEREKAHMVDVKALYLKAIDVRNYAFVLGVLLLVATVLFTRKPKLYHLSKSIQHGIGIVFAMILCLGIYAVLDFNRFWTNFHQLFFSNDLWLLDPNTEIMINMVPEPFFFALVLRIVLSFLIPVVVVLLSSHVLSRRSKI